jgi:hypothetical protein
MSLRVGKEGVVGTKFTVESLPYCDPSPQLVVASGLSSDLSDATGLVHGRSN